MVSALRRPVVNMSVAEFLDWADAQDGAWQLRDGEPEAMAPPSNAHATIQGELVYQLIAHLRATGRRCQLLVTPGVVPRVRADRTMLVPDIGVTCGEPVGGRSLAAPVLLVEILSPSNEAQSRANVWAYTTIPSVQEVLMLSSTSFGAELLRRLPDGSWPERPETLGGDAVLRLDSLGFAVPLRDLYADTRLNQAAPGDPEDRRRQA